MAELQELAKRWWSVAALILVAVLWLKSHDQMVVERANGRRTADSLAVALRVLDSAVAVGEKSRDSVRRLVRELHTVQAASARHQAEQEADNVSLITDILASVPDSVKAKVEALQAGFEQERVDFREQIAASARINQALVAQVSRDSTTIQDLRENLRKTNEGWQARERRGSSAFSKAAGIAIKVLAVKGAIDLVTN